MSVVIVTGSAGLIGAEACRHFAGLGMDIVGLDNDMRRHFFGPEASTVWQRTRLEQERGAGYTHADIDVRDEASVSNLFQRYGSAATLVIHTAAQPSHDWAARDPRTDFSVNAQGTLNLLECTRQWAPHAVFIFTSTNKVYGDTPNRLPLVETDTRLELAPGHAYADGITEDMSIDGTLHSVFGASKVAADIMVQEYGRYFGLATACFRGGCLTGPNHSGAALHGFLAYLMRCIVQGTPYTVFGYGGKQVRDNIHSADLIRAFECFFRNPRAGEVYNIGGHNEYPNLAIVKRVLAELGKPDSLIRYVKDRPGHDRRYAIDAGKIERDLGWRPRHTFEVALPLTVRWYQSQHAWLQRVRNGAYREYYARQYGS